MNVHKKCVLWILFLSIQGLGSYYAETDDGYYYSVEYEPLNYELKSEKSLDGGHADKDHNYHYAMDLALVFDSSYTITSEGWAKIKEAAKKLTNSLDVSPDGTHVSMLVYSTTVDDYYMFDDNANTRKISKLIDGLTYYGEWSRLDRALSALPHHVFSPFNGARSDVPKVVVVFTDGKLEGPSTRRSSQADLYKSLARSVDNLHREDVVVYGVATGASDSKVFDLIAGDRSRVFSIDNIEDLINSLLNISMRIYNAHFHHKEKESNKYASSSAAVGSAATLTTTIDMTVTVTAGESLLPMSPAQPISSTQTGQASKSRLTQPPVHQVSSSVGLAMASESVSMSGFTITSFTLTATASNSLPLNQHTLSALTPTSTVPLSLTPITTGTSTVTATPGGVSSVLPSQTLSSSSTGEASRPLSTTPSIQESLGAESTVAGASLTPTPSNQHITSTKTATSGELSLSMTSTAGAEPSHSKTKTVSSSHATSAISVPLATTPSSAIKPKESTPSGESSSTDINSIQPTSTSTTPSTSTSLATTPSSMATSMESATVGQTLSTASREVPSSTGTPTASEESTAGTTPSTESLASPKTASASESMSVVSSSQQASSLATISVSGSLSATRSSTATTSTPGSSAGIGSFGTVTTTVTVTVTPTPQIVASPSITSASGKTSSRDQIQDGTGRS